MKMPRYIVIGYEGRRWVAYYYLIDWETWGLGVSFDWRAPNVELHIGPGFFRIGAAKHWQARGRAPLGLGVHRRG